jgi:hypothetical protein
LVPVRWLAVSIDGDERIDGLLLRLGVTGDVDGSRTIEIVVL